MNWALHLFLKRLIHQLMLLHRGLAIKRVAHDSRLIVVFGPCQVLQLNLGIWKCGFEARLYFSWLYHAAQLRSAGMTVKFARLIGF